MLLAKKLTSLYLNELTQEGNNIVIHCSAGLHRTGTCGYTMLRMSGYQPKEAYDMLKTIREVTHRDVGDNRIEIAEKQIYPTCMAVLALAKKEG